MACSMPAMMNVKIARVHFPYFQHITNTSTEDNSKRLELGWKDEDDLCMDLVLFYSIFFQTETSKNTH